MKLSITIRVKVQRNLKSLMLWWGCRRRRIWSWKNSAGSASGWSLDGAGSAPGEPTSGAERINAKKIIASDYNRPKKVENIFISIIVFRWWVAEEQCVYLHHVTHRLHFVGPGALPPRTRLQLSALTLGRPRGPAPQPGEPPPQWWGGSRLLSFSRKKFYFEIILRKILFWEIYKYVCLNIEKKQDKRRGAEEKRMDTPRTPKDTPTSEGI